MNKKGFTLVELLATIGILVLMSLIIGVNITSILKSTEDNEKNNDKLTIEKAACVYVDLQSKCPNKSCDSNLTVNKLIEEGLLPDTYSDRASKTITIKRDGGLKTCTYNG